MKKRWTLIFGAAAVITLALAGCKDGGAYSALNECAGSDYSAVELTVSVNTAGDTLSGSYKAVSSDGGITVTYSFEQFNPIEKEGDDYVLPETAKSTLAGSMTVKDGKIVEQNGAQTDLEITAITAEGLRFEEGNFENVVSEKGSFKADVKDAAAFLGTEIVCTGMKVEAVYEGKLFQTVKVSYSTANSTVSLTYSFS